MSNLVSLATKIEAGARFILIIKDQDNYDVITDTYDIIQYEVTLNHVDESVYMAADNGKTGIESLTSFQANVEDGNYIEVL